MKIFPESPREISLQMFNERIESKIKKVRESNVEICVNHDRRLLDDDYE